MKKILGILIIVILIFQVGCSQDTPVVTGQSNYQEKGVTITDKGNYFDVVLDFTSGLTHRQMGEALARGVLAMVPNYEALVDSYIAENLAKYEYPVSFFRVEDIKPQLNQDYRDELDGMGSVFSGGDKNVWKDDKVSKQEVYLYNLLPDVIRNTQCSVVSVFGSRSATHKTITGRNLDWYGGKTNQLPKIQAVTTIKYKDKKICSVGYMGFMGIITGFNDSKVFAAILDSTTGEPYSSLGKRSYPLDIRFALENKATLNDVAQFLLDPSKLYAVNHIVALSDPNDSKILENNIGGTGDTGERVQRALRSSDSKLNSGITWGISDAIGCVNSFLLYGNFDNHTPNNYNTKRWKNMKKQLLASGATATVDDIKRVVSYNHGSPGTFRDSGDMYNKMTLQIIIFEPDTLSLEVFFHPKNTRQAPDKPTFEKVGVFQ